MNYRCTDNDLIGLHIHVIVIFSFFPDNQLPGYKPYASTLFICFLICVRL